MFLTTMSENLMIVWVSVFISAMFDVLLISSSKGRVRGLKKHSSSGNVRDTPPLKRRRGLHLVPEDKKYSCNWSGGGQGGGRTHLLLA